MRLARCDKKHDPPFPYPPELRGGLPEPCQEALLIEGQRNLMEEAHSFHANVAQE